LQAIRYTQFDNDYGSQALWLSSLQLDR
jgi:hypothetical protein